MSKHLSASQPHSGFRLFARTSFSGEVFPDKPVPILVPDDLADELEEIDLLEAERVINRREEERSQRDAFLNEQRTQAAPALRPAAKSAAPKPTIPDVLPRRPRNTVPVYDWTAATKRFRELESVPSSGDKDVVKRDLQQFSTAMASGPWRAAATPRNWRGQLNSLAEVMPNFAPVIAFIAQRLALAALSKTPLRPPPILLLGSPGVGKTHFTEQLATALGTLVHRQAFDNAQSNSALRGSDRHWGNTATGALWNLIVMGQQANPVILLDELDKSQEGHNSQRPADALLTLLEPITASRVKDVSVEFEFDASFAWYIATANYAERIGAPLRSRFTEFLIEEPDVDARLVLANSIFASTLERMVTSKRERSRFKPLSNLQVCRLAWLTPRQIRMASERILGAAALAERWHIEDADLDVALAINPTAGSKGGGAGSGRSKPGDDDDNGFDLLGVVIGRR